MKRFLLFLFLPIVAMAQNTATLTGTLTDPSSQSWNGAYWRATLNVPGGGNPIYVNGTPAAQSWTGNLSSSGVFSGSIGRNTQILPAGTSWTFTICPLASAPCQVIPNVYASGTTLNAGSTFSGLITSPVVQAGPLVYAYKEAEVQGSTNGNGYINTVTGVQYLYNGGSYQPVVSAGGPPTGAAGGDLSSTYPNPTVIGVGHVTTGILPGANMAIATLSARGAMYPDGTSCTVDGSGKLTCNGSTAPPAVLLSPTQIQLPQLVTSPCSPATDVYKMTITGSISPFLNIHCTGTGSPADVNVTWVLSNGKYSLQTGQFLMDASAGGSNSEFFSRISTMDGRQVFLGQFPGNPITNNFGNQGVYIFAPNGNAGLSVGNALSTAVYFTTSCNDHSTPLEDVYQIDVSGAGGPCTFRLNTSDLVGDGQMPVPVGRRFVIQKYDSSANIITISGQGGENIGTSSTYVLSKQGQNVVLQSNGTYWMILSQYAGYAGGSGTITDQTSSRADNTVYQNLTGFTLTASGSLSTTGSSTGTVKCLVGSSSTPTIQSWSASITATVSGGDAPFVCNLVPPNWYYEVESTGAVTTSIDSWTEATKP